MSTWTHLCFPSSTISPSPLNCIGNSTIATGWIIFSQICTGSDGVKVPAIILLKRMCLYLCSAPMIAVSRLANADMARPVFLVVRHPFNWGYWVALAGSGPPGNNMQSEDPCPPSLFWMLMVNMMEWFCFVACSSALLTDIVEPAAKSALVIFGLFASMCQWAVLDD